MNLLIFMLCCFAIFKYLNFDDICYLKTFDFVIYENLL